MRAGARCRRSRRWRSARAADDAPAHEAALAVLDARRGEAFAAAWRFGGSRLSGAAAVAPEALAALADPRHAPWLAVGDGAIRFRDRLEPASVIVPGDASRLHLVDGAALCELAARGAVVDREALVPDYVRRPDAEISHSPRCMSDDLLDIRRLTYADLPQVIAIERRAFPTPWSLAMFVLELSKPGGVCLAARRDQRLSGYIICSRFEEVWHLMNVAVEPLERRPARRRR